MTHNINGSDQDSGTTSTTGSHINSGSDTDHDSGSDTDASLDSENDHESGHDSGSSSGAGSDPESDVESDVARIQTWEEIASTIAGAQKRQIRHEAAEVAISSTPFLNVEELHAYTLALAQSIESQEYPAGFRLNEEYESIESYKTGRSSKPLVIPLPHQIWFPRIIVWCKALDLLKRLLICREATASPE